MSNLWIPGAIEKRLPIDPSRDPFIIPVGPIFHIAVSEADSLFDGFRRRRDGIESTGYIRRDGTLEQYRPLNVECDANGDGNSFVRGGKRYGFTSWESQGGEFGEWTDAQIATIQRIIVHHHTQLSPPTPLRLAPAYDQPGVGYHRLHSEWNHNGHTCPGPDRVKQFHRVIVPWMDQGAGTTQEEDMTPDQEKLLKQAAGDAKAGRRAAELALARGKVNTRLILRIEGETDESLADIKAELVGLDKEEAAGS